MRRTASAIVIILLLPSSGCAAYFSVPQPTCYATIAREALVSGAEAISSATGGQVPTLSVPDCDGWSSAWIAYPGIPKEDVAARMTNLPFCTEHSKKTQTWWQCYFSGSMLNVEISADDTPVSLGIVVAP